MAKSSLSRSLCVAGLSVTTLVAAAPALAAPPTVAVSITAGPAEGSHVASTSATFRFSSKSGQATFACSLDGAAATACTSPKTYDNLSQGAHTFTVTATASGTTSAPATRHWTVDTVAPKPTITPPASLAGPVVVRFGEAVTSATKNAIATLTLTDGGAAVPTTQTCWSGTKSVTCASASFDSVRLSPSAPLVAGQHYTATVAAGAVKDLAGNANAAATSAFRAARSLQENAPTLTTTWQTVTAKAAAGGSYVREHRRGAAARWSFTGTTVTWTTVTGPGQGKADVYVDGVRKSTVNNYAAKTHYGVARTVSGLTNKAHALRIVVLGVKGSKSATNTFVAVDVLTAGKATTQTPTTTTWRRLAAKYYSGGHASIADLRGETLAFAFRGTGLTFVTQKGVNQGKVQLWLDGALKWTIDDYATSTTVGVQRKVTGLTDSVHNVRFVVLGRHHKGGKGNVVTFDRFIVA